MKRDLKYNEIFKLFIGSRIDFDNVNTFTELEKLYFDMHKEWYDHIFITNGSDVEMKFSISHLQLGLELIRIMNFLCIADPEKYFNDAVALTENVYYLSTRVD